MRDDAGYLLDMLLYAASFLAGLTWNNSRTVGCIRTRSSRLSRSSAKRISPQTRAAHPEIPWSEVIGMRHRLVHGYFEVDLQKVWDTVHRDLPLLIAQIEPLVPPEESNAPHHH
ncbi:DUF86 domain-containing protein [Chloracidobacterium aggregatum]|uniref:HepT-like ribonuclease domain-containing protein n=1 Tax=Chloracidobacterium aggregatum TaxID=2851959 RepID=UPI002016FC3F|nr:HepT-like ribonuclease domain-containing protein [Chloracidobacterium aggregatum]